jgi:hypothetical protein
MYKGRAYSLSEYSCINNIVFSVLEPLVGSNYSLGFLVCKLDIMNKNCRDGENKINTNTTELRWSFEAKIIAGAFKFSLNNKIKYILICLTFFLGPD